jgi:hypothetical protein
MSMNEYVTHFTQLSHYAPGNVDIENKKHDYFLNKLNDDLAYAVEVHVFVNFQAMVDKALVCENRRGMIDHKHKMQC